MMCRRTLLASAGALAAPRVGLGAAASVMRFIPQADLAVLDPIWTAAYVTRDHGMMVFDTLDGTDDAYCVAPQMVAGDTTEDDGRTWNLTLRDGLCGTMARKCLRGTASAASGAGVPATPSARPCSRSARRSRRPMTGRSGFV